MLQHCVHAPLIEIALLAKRLLDAVGVILENVLLFVLERKYFLAKHIVIQLELFAIVAYKVQDVLGARNPNHALMQLPVRVYMISHVLSVMQQHIVILVYPLAHLAFGVIVLNHVHPLEPIVRIV